MYAKKILFTAATAPALGKSQQMGLTLFSFQCSSTRLLSTRTDVLTIRTMKLTDAKRSWSRKPRTSLRWTRASMFGLARTWTSSRRNGQWSQWLLVACLITLKRLKLQKWTREEKRDMMSLLLSTRILPQMVKSRPFSWTEAGYHMTSRTWSSITTTQSPARSLESYTEAMHRRSIRSRTVQLLTNTRL